MQLIDKNSEEVKKQMPYINGIIKEHFQDKCVYLYCYKEDDKLGFIAMCAGKGILVKGNGTCIKFQTGSTGALSRVEKNGYVLCPRIDYSTEKDFEITTTASIKDKNGNELNLCIYPSYAKDIYPNRVCFTQYNEHKDLYCEINYNYIEDGTISPGLINKPESIHIISKTSKKGISCKTGFVPKRMQVYSKAIIDSETLNYTFISFNENGVFNTLKNGAYKLYDGREYITRYCKLGFMSPNRNLIELPWPLGDYKTEEEMFQMVKDNGFNETIPMELIDLVNNNDNDVNFIEGFLSIREEANNNKALRKIYRVK